LKQFNKWADRKNPDAADAVRNDVGDERVVEHPTQPALAEIRVRGDHVDITRGGFVRADEPDQEERNADRKNSHWILHDDI
jgi:hypothetical protein